MKKSMTGHPLVIYAAALILFSAFVAADAFLLEERYALVPPEMGEQSPQVELISTDTCYQDAGVSIQLTEHRAYDSTIYVADIRLTDLGRMQTAFAENTYGRNVTQKAADIARSQGAILAINGDYYGARRAGYVIRNGELYRSQSQGPSQQDACIWADGTMTLIMEGNISAEELKAQGALQVFSFGPGLIEQSQVIVTAQDEVGRAMAANPRTAIAMVEPMHFLFVVADGRTNESRGPSLYELACFLQEMGAQVAYNLDGGGSSTLVFQGEVRNFPTTNGRYQERAVSDIVCIR